MGPTDVSLAKPYFGSEGKTENLPTRQPFWPSVTWGFVDKKQLCLPVFDFSPHFRNPVMKGRESGTVNAFKYA